MFFIVINIIMIGGQILIIFVGGEAFKITHLTGKEWALSIGLGAISIPWGAFIRCIPDEWAEKCVPGFIHRRWLSPPAEGVVAAEKSDDDDDFRPPLRVMSSIRGPRVQQHIGFRDRMHKIKERAKEKAKEAAKESTTHEKVSEPETEVVKK